VFLSPFGAAQERGKNTTLLSSMTVEGMGPFLAMEGATIAVVFARHTWSGCWLRAFVDAT
jgi:hypothetical protein